MNIFGKKRIAELERELEETKRTRDKFARQLGEYKEMLDTIHRS